jgi:anti-sigma regulatory factor (Ser/Thr protein kinase)
VTALQAGNPPSPGYLHEMGVYGSDAEFEELICPFALEGIERGEPVVFSYDEAKTGLLKRRLPASSGVFYVTDTGPYDSPAKALAAWRRLVEGLLASGASRVRIAGDVPHPGYGHSYVGWDRYEAAFDDAMGDLPVWAPCLYDSRITPPEVLETAVSRHHHLLDQGGVHRANSSYRQPECLGEFLIAAEAGVGLGLPVLELLDPTPSHARSCFRDAVSGRISTEQEADLTLALSEVVTNAWLHGVAPVSLRMWLTASKVVVEVHDNGSGPADPFVGLLPGRQHDSESGRGLWLAHQLATGISLVPNDDGFTVRLSAGETTAVPT